MSWREWRLLLSWLFVFGLVFVGGVVALGQGYWNTIIRADNTGFSVVIFWVFVLGLGWNFINMLRIQRELRCVYDIEAFLTSSPRYLENCKTLPAVFRGACADHINTLSVISRRDRGRVPDQGNLIEALHAKIELAEKYTLYICGALTALGFFGTLIGFMVMSGSAGLGSLTSDVSSVEKTLGGINQVLAGIKTAINTTIVGLLGSLILLLFYQLVDNSITRFVIVVTEVSERHVLPVLRRSTSG